MITAPDNKTRLYQVAIAVIAALFFIPCLGGVHLFDWDEINFAESAREMIESGDYLTVQINFIPFWEKPPLFIWMQALSMKTFGINEFSARLPNAICGIITLLLLFNIGRKLMNLRFAFLWVLLFGGSVLPFLYFKSGIIDPWFNLFIFLGVYQIYLYFSSPDAGLKPAAGSAFFIGLAILTKGPVALLIFLLTAALILVIKKFRVHVRFKDVLVFAMVLAFTGGFWFILQLMKGNFAIIADFMVYQIRLFKTKDAGHGGFLFYHFVVLFLGVFPASVCALPSLFKPRPGDAKSTDFMHWMQVMFWVVLILFTIVKTKIVHYSSLCYFPLTFLAAWSVYQQHSFHKGWRKITFGLVLGMGFLLALVFIGLTGIDRFKDKIISQDWIDDPFAISCLAADAGWKGYEYIAGLILLIGLTGFIWTWKKGLHEKAILVVAATVPWFMFTAMILIVPRIEAYSQRAAIEFFNSVSDEDAYLETVGYKSYVHFFYGRVKDHPHELARDEQWLLSGDIDKPVYCSIKVTRKGKFMVDYPSFEYLYEKNGFVFLKRMPDGER